MKVIFRRTGNRRHAIAVVFTNRSPLEMDPAPGFDSLVPHDLLHLVVESELGLRNGIFGQVAAGGDARTFRPPAAEATPRDRNCSRRQRRESRRGRLLAQRGNAEAAHSERATYLAMYEWLARSPIETRRARAAEMAPEAEHIRRVQPSEEHRAMSEEIVGRICARLDDFSARWISLKVGESVCVEWPDSA